MQLMFESKTDLYKKCLIRPAAVFVCCFASGSILAAEDAAPLVPEPAFTLAGNVSLVSDYLFRGISQTWGKPALQFSAEASHASGLYGGVFASNVSDQMYPGTHMELDLYGGKRGKLPGAMSMLNYDLGLIYIYYPGGNYDEAKFAQRYASSKFNTAEIYASLNYKWLTVKAGRTLTEFFGWNTNNSGVGGGFYGDPEAGVTGSTRGSWYAEGALNVDVAAGWSLSAVAGHQTIADSKDLNWDYYKLGTAYSLSKAWAASLSYSATSDTKAYRNFWGLQNTGSTYDVARSRALVAMTYNF